MIFRMKFNMKKLVIVVLIRLWVLSVRSSWNHFKSASFIKEIFNKRLFFSDFVNISFNLFFEILTYNIEA
jgi:hypothetical protein